ncbi:MAG: hypothetical protein ABI183_00975, partial [Polyangiaceae bacterium]
MKRFFVSAGFILCAAVSAFAIDADAQQTLVTRDTFGRPNAWDLAMDPTLMGDFEVHVSARRLLLQADELRCGRSNGSKSSVDEAMCDNVFARATLLLTKAISKGGKDPRLQFDLGEVLQQEDRNEDA